ncbi:hypothetical protein [Bradyrhizobium sp. SYSU BS000235]|uniref:hypothetical protein n=1 Tax=Bradyrhizobium sp. SYSU BS000235 TaxID=3411332 RepID=UPI003C75E5BD
MAQDLTFARCLHTGFRPRELAWDMRLRPYKILDTAFEWIGRALAPRQAASLYVIAEKPTAPQPALTGGS